MGRRRSRFLGSFSSLNQTRGKVSHSWNRIHRDIADYPAYATISCFCPASSGSRPLSLPISRKRGGQLHAVRLARRGQPGRDDLTLSSCGSGSSMVVSGTEQR